MRDGNSAADKGIEGEFFAATEEEMLDLGASLGAELKAGDIVLLEAPLGAGKTTFVKGIGRALGVQEPVTSPSFTIISVYQGRLPLYHMDFYRINDVEELALIGPEEYFYAQGVCAVEWPGPAKNLLPDNFYRVEISIREDGRRRLLISQGTDAQ